MRLGTKIDRNAEGQVVIGDQRRRRRHRIRALHRAARPRSRKDQPPDPRQAQPDTRRDKVTRIIASQPGRDWAGHDLADLLGIKPRNMLTQLAEWTRLGFLAKTGPGRYALPAPASTTADAGP